MYCGEIHARLRDNRPQRNGIDAVFGKKLLSRVEDKFFRVDGHGLDVLAQASSDVRMKFERKG